MTQTITLGRGIPVIQRWLSGHFCDLSADDTLFTSPPPHWGPHQLDDIPRGWGSYTKALQNLLQILRKYIFCSFKMRHHIIINFCTCHGSSAAMACAKVYDVQINNITIITHIDFHIFLLILKRKYLLGQVLRKLDQITNFWGKIFFMYLEK